jgi:signal transduction histidine kinase
MPELTHETSRLKGQVELARDPSGTLTLADILASDQTLHFVPSREDAPVFGLDRAAVWVRFAARLPADEAWTFTIRNSSLRDVTAFMPSGDGAYTRIDKGVAHAVSEGTRWAFALSEAAKAGQVVYLRISSGSSIRLPMTLERTSSFLRNVLQEMVFLGALVGLLAGVGLYVFAVWLAMRDRAQLQLCFLIGAILLWVSANTGFLSEFLFPSQALAAALVAVPSVILLLSAAVAFASTILLVPERLPRIGRAMAAFAAFLAAMAAVSAFDVLFLDGVTRRVVVYLLFSTLIGILGIAIHALVKGVPTARLFLIGWTPTLIVGLARTLVDDRLIPLNVFTNNAVFVGLAISVLSFAVTLAMFIRQRERMAAEALMDATRKRAERERMAALGEVAGGVAHEVNNLLHPIANFVKEARLALPPDAQQVAPLLDRASRAALSAGEIVRKVLDFSRQVRTARDPIDFRSAVSDALTTLRMNMRCGVAVDATLCHDRLPVLATRTEVMQVLANVLANASYPANEASRIEVTLERARIAGGDIAVLTVEDDGCGIKPDFKSKVFEPFFTTKPIGEGTGLGLALVSATVKAWGGSTEVEAVETGGARFVFRMPLAPDAERPAAAGGDVAIQARSS